MKKFLFISIIAVFILCFAAQKTFAFAELNLRGLKPDTAGPGVTVTLFGSGFGSSMGKSQVLLGSVQAQVVSWNDKEIRIIIPGDVKAVDLTEKETRRGTVKILPVKIKLSENVISEPVYINIVPQINQISPRQGGPGDIFTIRGKSFGSYMDLGKIYAGSTEASVISWSDTRVEFVFPDSVKPEDVKMHKDRRGREAGRMIEITLQAGELKSEPENLSFDPAITAVIPDSLSLGDTLEIRGRNFGRNKDSVEVLLGTISVEPLSLSNNKLEVIAPYSITSDQLKEGKLLVRVRTAGIESNDRSINVTPHIKRINPSSYKGGIIVINGENFGSKKSEGEIIIKTPKGSAPCNILEWDTGEIRVEISEEDLKKVKSAEDQISTLQVKNGGLVSNEIEFTIKAEEKTD